MRLYVDLRGYDAEAPPADPAAVLGAFLRLLGVPGDQVQHLDLDRRVAAFRTALAGAVLVLDNAADTGQLRPLLPGVPGSRTLITSRRGLAGLAEAAGPSRVEMAGSKWPGSSWTCSRRRRHWTCSAGWPARGGWPPNQPHRRTPGLHPLN